MQKTSFFSFLIAFVLIAQVAFAGSMPATSAESKNTKAVIEQLEAQIEAKILTRTERKTLSKAEKKEYRQELKQLKKQRRIAKFASWYAASAKGDNGIIAILLCFFLGGLAIHRVFLGGAPILILGYFLTFGGIFGILPFIDFIRLIIGGTGHYEGNDSFFAAFQ
jgi:hypothetical protein